MRVEIEHLHKRFGAIEVLRDVSLAIPPGGRVALVGPNGSGKSTLIRALLGLLACEGRIAIDDRSPTEDRRALARRLAYVPQIAPQLGAPVSEVVAAVAALRGLDETRIAEAARALDLHLAEVAPRRFRDLSGGMKQKLLIALALAADPALLVLDEPTASLDAEARARFFRLYEERARAATLILCSHRADDVRNLADRVVQMGEGRVLAELPATVWLDGARDEEAAPARGSGARFTSEHHETRGGERAFRKN